MLLRNSISSTKRFFQKTLHSFKSLFSGSDYQRLPKSTPPHMNIQTTYGKDFDTFYADHFTNQLEPSSANNNNEIKAIKRQRPNKKNVINNVTSSSSSSSLPMKQESEGFMMKGNNRKNLKTKNVHHADSSFSSGRGMMMMMMREERSCWLADMLKELELMDMSNVDQVLDIEEFLHYYSRLTCPAYVDIVDKFFIEIYAEFFGHHSAISTPACISSRPNKLRS